MLQNWKRLIPPGLLLLAGGFEGFLRFLDWIFKGKDLFELYELLPAWLQVLQHPLVPVVLIAAGFIWLSFASKTQRPILYNAQDKPIIPSRPKLILLTATSSAIVALVLAGVVFYWWTRSDESPQDTNKTSIETDLPTPATVPLSLSQPSLGSTQFPSSTPIPPPVSPRLEIIFKSSPLFTPARKERVESAIQNFHAYLGKLGFKPPTTVPPIEVVPGSSALGRQGGSGSIYRAELLIGEANLDDMTGITLMWADHAFMAMIEPIGISNEFAFRDHTVSVFAAYYTLSFTGTFDPKYGRDAWPTALWKIRTQYGQEFTDKAMFYTFMMLGERGPTAKDFNSFFRRALRSGTDVIDNRSGALLGILKILREYGLIE